MLSTNVASPSPSINQGGSPRTASVVGPAGHDWNLSPACGHAGMRGREGVPPAVSSPVTGGRTLLRFSPAASCPSPDSPLGKTLKCVGCCEKVVYPTRVSVVDKTSSKWVVSYPTSATLGTLLTDSLGPLNPQSPYSKAHSVPGAPEANPEGQSELRSNG